jgi:hypothetical protein
MGQTEEATRVLELIQEYEALAFIREKSQDSPDLLPGLCLYSEQWLQQEVFPHFRDLAQQQASLKDYFADRQVQAYLESLPTDAKITNEWSVINHQSFPQPDTNYSHYSSDSTRETQQNHHQLSHSDLTETHFPSQSEPTQIANHVTNNGAVRNQSSFVHSAPANNPKKPHQNNSNPAKATNPQNPKRRRRKASNNNIAQRLLESQTNFLRNLDPRTRLVWLVFLSSGSLLILWLLASTSFNLIKNILFPSPSLQGQQLAIQLNESPINIPDPNSQPEPTDEELTKETAQEVIESWLSAKAAALGSNYQIDGLNQILTGPALLQWQSVVEEEQKQEKYRQYKHTVEVLSVSKKGIDENSLYVDAKVQEATQFYANGQQQKSTNENLRVRYDLIRKDGKWHIQRMSVLQKFL